MFFFFLVLFSVIIFVCLFFVLFLSFCWIYTLLGSLAYAYCADV